MLRRYPWASVTIALVAILFLGITLIAFGLEQSPGPNDEFWIDVAKAGLQVAVITFIGLLVNVLLKSVDERRRRDEQRLEVFRSIILAYNQVKAVRRNLRTLGFLEPPGKLNALQARGLREQMSALNDAQLSLEAIKREVDESRLFISKKEIVAELVIAEKYLTRDIHDRWEEAGGLVWEGSAPESLRPLALVESFIGRESDGHREFEMGFSDPLRRLR